MAFDQLEAEAFWRDLAPDLMPLTETDQAGPVLVPNADAVTTMLGVFDREGYLRLPRGQDVEQIRRLAGLVERLHAAGLPAVFGFIYDEMWRPFRRLSRVIECLLGGPHAVMPDFWAWRVDPALGEAGWAPHRDRADFGLYPDLRPRAVTVWIPLTEATPLNSCMYVVPKHLDPDYRVGAPNTFAGSPADIRAVPSIPGDTLIWTQALIHWGSRSSELATAPRLSMSVEFQRADEPPLSGFFMSPGQRLSFAQKLSLVGFAIARYTHMQKLDSGLTAAAIRWRDRIPELFQGGDR